MCAIFAKGPQRPRPLLRDARGVVFVEFLLVFPVLLTMFLCALQLALICSAEMGARFAASRTARAAAVVFSEGSGHYNGEPALKILGDSQCAKSEAKSLHLILKTVSSTASMPGSSKCRGGRRVSDLRVVAIASMVPFGTTLSSVVGGRAFGSGAGPWLASSAAYGLGATALAFPEKLGSNKLHESGITLSKKDDVVVRVTQLFHCAVPVARHLLCGSKRSWLAPGFLRTRADDDSQAYRELEEGVAQPRLFKAILASGSRFKVIRKDAAFPMQGADYED